MKTITFIRHGKPIIWNQYSPFSMISSKKIGEILISYDRSDVEHHIKNEQKLVAFIKKGDLFLSSNLTRTHKSFELLGITEYKTNNLLNEARLPSDIMPVDIKLPLFTWAFLLRILWLLGYHNNTCESLKEFKNRMDQAVQYLEGETDTFNHIIIMAHGFVNFFMIRKLLKKGWKKTTSSITKKFWSYTQIAINQNI